MTEPERYEVASAQWVSIPYEAVRVEWTVGSVHLLPLEKVSPSQLPNGKIVDEDTYEQYAALHAELSAWQGALRRIQKSQCSGVELKRSLLKSKHTPEVATIAVERAIQLGLVDDAAMASRISEQKFRSQAKGRTRIRMELMNRGISAKDAREATSAWSDEDEYETAMRWASGKWAGVKGEGRERATRFARKLQQRGYSAPVIRRVVAHFTSFLDNEE